MLSNREGIIGVFSGKTGHKGCEGVGWSHHILHSLLKSKCKRSNLNLNPTHCQVFPTEDGTEVPSRFPMHPSHNLPLGEDGEALVEPEVLEVDVGDEVAGPGVGDLVGDHRRVGLVPW